MAIFDVTTGQSFATVSAAILGSNAGDVIQVPAGVYHEDFPKITHDLTIQGVGGMATLTPLLTVNPGPGDPVYQMPSNGQGILVTRGAVTLDHLELTGAAAADGNGAGVRYETGTLTLTNSWLHGNQNGLLANPNAGANIIIDRSEFDHNGAGDGYTHNLYVNQIGTLSISNSYFHDPVGGHEIKSRADTTIITGTRIQDQGGDASFSVDLPNGGIGLITSSVIEKGSDAPNWFLVHYGGESVLADGSMLTIGGVTVINNYAAPELRQSFVYEESLLGSGEMAPVAVSGSTFYGFVQPQLLAGPGEVQVPGADGGGNAFLPLVQQPGLDTSHPWEVPEPAMAPLLALALGCVVLFRRRRAS